MSRVAELIDLIVQGKNTEASDVLNSELLSRSYEAINGIKPQVAADYFSPVVDFGDNTERIDIDIHPEDTIDDVPEE